MVQVVTNLFALIDELSKGLVYKVCTIGDCYVATNLLEDDDHEEDNLIEWEAEAKARAMRAGVAGQGHS